MFGIKCIAMEDFPASEYPPAEEVERRIRQSDIFVGLVGLCYGSLVPHCAVSFTEYEYDLAQGFGKPCFLFLVPEDFLTQGNILHEDGGWEKQQIFRRRVQASRTVATFSSPADVALQVVTAIRDWEQRDLPRPFRSEKLDCILLSGGFSTRLWPLTYDFSKHLLPVAGKPVLAHALSFVMSSSSVGRIFLLTSPKFETQTKNFLSNYMNLHGRCNAEVIVEPATEPGRKLGPVGALEYATNMSGPQDCLIVAGDNLFGFRLDDLIDFARRTGKKRERLVSVSVGRRR